jgi:hypothetical protein
MDEGITFGTDHIENVPAEILFKRAKGLSLELFNIDLTNPQNTDRTDFSKILKLFEIIRFSRKRFPYLLALDYDESLKLKKILFCDDPHYRTDSGVSKAISGQVTKIPDFIRLNKNPLIIKNILSKIVLDQKNTDKRICIAGTNDAILVLGRPKTEFFKNKKPFYTYVRPGQINYSPLKRIV